MDIWLAVMGDGGPEESIIGAYSSEELAAAAVERVSPGDWYTIHVVLDEAPDWIEMYEQEHKYAREHPQNQPHADVVHPQPATQDTRKSG